MSNAKTPKLDKASESTREKKNVKSSPDPDFPESDFGDRVLAVLFFIFVCLFSKALEGILLMHNQD